MLRASLFPFTFLKNPLQEECGLNVVACYIVPRLVGETPEIVWSQATPRQRVVQGCSAGVGTTEGGALGVGVIRKEAVAWFQGAGPRDKQEVDL